MSETSIKLWNRPDGISIPANADDASDLVTYSRQLAERDTKAIVRAFDSEDYEMMATFVWSKAAAALKSQIASFGMDFVGEMLGRKDLDSDSEPTSSIRDYEAVKLAEQLGMVDTTEAMRLRHAMQLVNHFAQLGSLDGTDPDGMDKSEAISVLRTCIKSVLGLPRVDVAYQFQEFRARLEAESLPADDHHVLSYSKSPYFFRKTILSVLVSLLRKNEGAQLEHVIGNVNLILPIFWQGLRHPERWDIGRAYADLYADGLQRAAVGLRKALLTVKGFDYVPENLRSHTFSAAARKVIVAHSEFNNYYKEPEPMKVLAGLGSTIPKPAFPVVMTATMCVRLGNYWGRSSDAQEPARRLLKTLRPEQWSYYLTQCLPADTAILSKINGGGKQLVHWKKLCEEFELEKAKTTDRRIAKLIDPTTDDEQLEKTAAALVKAAGAS